MTVFARKLSDYIGFQRVVLILVAVVGLLRLVLSLAGVPNGSVKWLSMTVITGTPASTNRRASKHAWPDRKRPYRSRTAGGSCDKSNASRQCGASSNC